MSPSEIAARPSPLSDPSPFRLPSPTPASLRGLPRSSSARILDLLSTNDGQSSLVSDRHGGAARIHWQFSPSRARVPTDTPQVFETPRGKSSPALNDNHVSARGRDVEEVRRDLGISLGQLMGDLFADADARPDMRPGRSAAMLRGRHDAAWDRISSSIEL